MQPTTTPSDVEALMPFVLPHMQFLNEVSKLPAKEQTRRIAMVLAALRGK
jgi:hypothetical protein